jgi:hypothetical protein
MEKHGTEKEMNRLDVPNKIRQKNCFYLCAFNDFTVATTGPPLLAELEERSTFKASLSK